MALLGTLGVAAGTGTISTAATYGRAGRARWAAGNRTDGWRTGLQAKWRATGWARDTTVTEGLPLCGTIGTNPGSVLGAGLLASTTGTTRDTSTTWRPTDL